MQRDWGESTNNMIESAAAQMRAAETSASAAHVDIWSTGTVLAREKVSYWRESVCSAVFGISVETTPEQFSARITARNVGPLRFAISESTGYQIARNRRDIDARPSDHYSIYLQLGGKTVSSMNDETFTFDASDIGIYDGRQPFRAMHGGRRAIAVMPSSSATSASGAGCLRRVVRNSALFGKKQEQSSPKAPSLSRPKPRRAVQQFRLAPFRSCASG